MAIVTVPPVPPAPVAAEAPKLPPVLPLVSNAPVTMESDTLMFPPAPPTPLIAPSPPLDVRAPVLELSDTTIVPPVLPLPVELFPPLEVTAATVELEIDILPPECEVPELETPFEVMFDVVESLTLMIPPVETTFCKIECADMVITPPAPLPLDVTRRRLGFKHGT